MPDPVALFLGDSLTTGYGLSNAVAQRWPAQLCSLMNWTEDNQAVGAKQVSERGQTDELLGRTITSDSITCVLSGMNDMLINGADADQLAVYKGALGWVLATAAVPTDQWITADNATAVGGSWINQTVLNGLYQSGSAGAFREYGVVGSSVVVLLAKAYSPGNMGTWTITVDGDVAATGSADMLAPTKDNRTYQGDYVVLSGLSSGPHTVRVTADSAGIAYSGKVVGLSGPLSPGPTVLCGGVTEVADYSFAAPSDQGSEAARAMYSAAIKSVCNELRGAGLGVRYAAASIDPAEHTTDGLHFNAEGALLVANQYQSAMSQPAGHLRRSLGGVFISGFAEAGVLPAGEVIG